MLNLDEINTIRNKFNERSLEQLKTKNPDPLLLTSGISTECELTAHADAVIKVLSEEQAQALLHNLLKGGSITAQIKKQQPKHKSVIYFVQGQTTKLIKIGISTNFKERIESIKTLSAEQVITLGLMWGNRTIEQLLHMRFKQSHEHGEWFRPTEDILQYIKENCMHDFA
jgi:hypothetical protein